MSAKFTGNAVVYNMIEREKDRDMTATLKDKDTTCPHCGAHLILIRRLGVWACDPGTRHRHVCIERATR